jgi:hypothetical protein
MNPGMSLRIYYKIAALTVLLMLSSCYPEWKLARTFVSEGPESAILVLPANYVFKKNLKVDELENTTGLTDSEIDSALMANSLFLQKVSDSVFLETFINSLIQELDRLGFKVFLENQLDSILFAKTPAYLFNIAQIELEEHYSVHEDKETFGGFEYYKNVDLNAITYNFWFEISELNDEEGNRKLFFSSETINDVVFGYFTENLFTGEIKYKYTLDEIDLDILYRYAGIFGIRYAGYTFDYIMNEFITERWPPDKKRRFYMHYNPENNTLDPTLSERFVEMEE